MPPGLTEMLGHNAWANRRLLDVCSGLTEEQLDATAEGTFGSIRDTLVHVVEAEEHYLFRLTEERAHPPIQDGQWPGFPELRQRSASNAERFSRLVGEEDPERVVRWTTRDGDDATMPVALFLVQTIHHGNEHRSQIATLLTRLGIEPPELSGWLYAIETGALTGVTA
jgi:uncharacterized damage-inducible protein DinB